MNNKQVKLGAIISYVLIILNATYGLFLTPFIIGQIGDASYGVYKTVSAFTAALMVLDLGLGGTMMRYIAKYKADKEDEKIPNFIFMGLCQTGVVCFIVGAVTAVLYFFLGNIFAEGLTPAQIDEAKSLYIFLAIGILAHIVENFLNGVITGFNRFVFANGIKVIRLAVRILAIVLLLGVFKDSMFLVVIDLICTVFFILVELLYIALALRVKIRFTHWDGGVFFESFKYTILMFLTAIVAQANSNFSNIAIGAKINAEAVTVYSLAVLIFGMYEQMSTAISGVMLPTITNSLKNDDENCTGTLGIVAGAGRIQFMLLGAVFAGFIVLGQPFVEVWMGKGYEDVYFLTIILLGPALLELCVNVCLSILRAKNMLGFRTAVITLSTVLNIAITLGLMPYIGYYSCAIGTASSFLLGSVITMGIYYYKKLHINILKLYGKIFSGIWLCIIISAAAAFGVSYIAQTAILKFLLGFVTFVVVYAATLLLFGLKKDEKNKIIKIFRRKTT